MWNGIEVGLQLANLEHSALRDFAQEAEELGFDFLTCPDHIVHERVAGAHDPATLAYDPIVSAAVMTLATKQVKIGHLVLSNLFRHPAITAQALMSLDRLSGGRVVAGLGTGWTETEYRMTGIEFPDVKTRLARLDEALTCMRSLWTKDRTTFHGEHYRFEDAILWPKPIGKLPFLVGGSGKGLLRIAAKHADIVNVIAELGRAGRIEIAELGRMTDAAWRAKVAFVREEAARHGRDPSAIRISNVIFTLVLTSSREETIQLAEGMVPILGPTPEAVRTSPLALLGTPEEAIAELRRRVREWDVSQFIFSGGAEKQMRRLAEEILRYV